MIIIAGNEIVKATASNKILLKRRRDKRVCLKFEARASKVAKIKSVTIQRSQDGVNFYSIGICNQEQILKKGYIDDGSQLFKELYYRFIIEDSCKALTILNSTKKI